MAVRERALFFLLFSFLLPGTVPSAPAASRLTATDFSASREEVVRTLRDLIRIDTSNPPGNESQVARYVESVLAKEGIPSEIFAKEPGRGNLVARLSGSGKKRPLLLMAHSDVVGVERDKWTVDPFEAVVRDGYVYGRGALDDKAMLAAAVELLLLLHREAVPLDRDVILLVEAGEEGTTEVGIDFMVEQHWDRIDCEYALNEGGKIAVEGGSVRYVAVATTEKVPWRGIRLVARGTSGHGSMPRPDNPVVHLAAAVAEIGAHPFPMRLNETTRAYFERLAGISPPEEAFLFRHLDDPVIGEMVQEKLRYTNVQANSMLRTTASPNIIEGGFRRNVIPAEAEATLDVRALPDEDLDAFLEALSALIDDPRIEITRPSSSRPAAPPSSLSTELFGALERVQKEMFPAAITLPTMLTGATDSAQLRARGVQAYGVGTLQSAEDSRAHGNDERVSAEGLGRFVEFLYRTVVQVAGARP